MNCILCNTEMTCVDDVVTEMLRIDWLECTKCKSHSQIKYGDNGRVIDEIVWKRN